MRAPGSRLPVAKWMRNCPTNPRFIALCFALVLTAVLVAVSISVIIEYRENCDLKTLFSGILGSVVTYWVKPIRWVEAQAEGIPTSLPPLPEV